MARILVGYELGAGHGHVHRLLPVVRALEAKGHEVTFFLRNIRENVQLLAKERRAILPVPDLVQRIPGAPNPAPLATYLDIMCHSGFLRRQSLHAGILAWRTLLKQARADLVVADHSPVLLLACYGEIPAVQVADGFTLPPAQEADFPIFRPGAKPMIPPDHVLQIMQDVQRHNRLPVPETVTAPFRTAGRLVCTLPELDPYRDQRQDPVVGPVEGLQAALPGHPSAQGGKPHFFAYVSLEHKKTRPFLRALKESKISGEIFVRQMTDQVAKAIARPGLTVHREAQPMAEVLKRASVIIHHGGNGTCCAALSAGRPQLLLPTHMEARLSANALADLGVGRLLLNKDVEPDAFPAILEEACGDRAMAEAATALAAEIAARPPYRTVERIVETCLEVLAKGKTTAA
jgi:UDP:flavonoid glycosyltransferase YjiC (YdhE family)